MATPADNQVVWDENTDHRIMTTPADDHPWRSVPPQRECPSCIRKATYGKASCKRCEHYSIQQSHYAQPPWMRNSAELPRTKLPTPAPQQQSLFSIAKEVQHEALSNNDSIAYMLATAMVNKFAEAAILNCVRLA